MTCKTKTILLAGTYFHFSSSHLRTQGNHSKRQQHWGKGTIPFPITSGIIFFLLQWLTKSRVRKASPPRYFMSVLQLSSGRTASAELPLRETCSRTTGSFLMPGSLSWPKRFSSSCTLGHVKLVAPRLKETRGTLTNQGLCHWSFQALEHNLPIKNKCALILFQFYLIPFCFSEKIQIHHQVWKGSPLR